MSIPKNYISLSVKKRFDLLILLLCCFVFFSNCSRDSSQVTKVFAKQGELHLENWNFQEKGAIQLDGEWQYFESLLLNPNNRQDFSLEEYVDIPHTWKKDGFATYQLTIFLPQNISSLSLKVPSFGTASYLWINDKFHRLAGQVGSTQSTSIPNYQSHIITFKNTEKITLLIGVSNFDYSMGGLWYSLQLGAVSQIYTIKQHQIMLEVFLGGSLSIMGLYHFSLYFFRKKSLEALYFGFFCLCIAIRVSVTGERIFTELHLPWEWLIKIEYLSFYVAVPLFSLYTKSLFQEEVSKRVNQIICWFATLFSLKVIFTPVKIFTEFILVYQIVLVILCLYIIYAIIIKAVWRKREGAIFFSIGFLFLFMTTINDLLYNQMIINTGDFFAVGILGFIFFQSLIISSKFSKSFQQNEILMTTFEKFVPQNFLVKVAKEGIKSIEVGNAELTRISILFSDIRGFTSLSEKMTPNELLRFMNAYFGRMNVPIHHHQGFIDKFIGDGILALFEHESHQNNGAFRAIQAAIAMQKEIQVYNQHRDRMGYSPLQIGIGIHTGNAIIGIVGSKSRMDSTVIGDSVNLASRLEGLTKIYDAKIIVSSETWKSLDEEEMKQLTFRELDYLTVKGREEPITIFEVLEGEIQDVFEQKKQILDLYYEGLILFREQNYEQAQSYFESCLEILTKDVPCEIYQKRCRECIHHAPSTQKTG